MDRLLSRARTLPSLRSLPFHLLPALLSHSDSQPERVSQGVVLFQRGDRLHCWYLLLSGQVQLCLADVPPPPLRPPIKLVGPGQIFGELQSRPGAVHCCGAKVLRTVEFVRIDQRHFMALYNKWADQLQNCIVPMEDLVATAENGTKMAKNGRKNGQRMREEEEEAEDEEEQGEVGGAEEGRKRRTRGGRERQGRGERRQSGSRQRRRDPGHEGAERTQLVELGSGHFCPEEQIRRSSSHLRDAIASGMDGSPISGSELCFRLRALCAQCLPDLRQPFGTLLIQGMCQSLLDLLLLSDVHTDHPLFRDSPSALYLWTLPDPDPDPSASIAPLPSVLLLLALSASESLLQHILRKPKDQRTRAELALVFGELSHIRAFSHLSRSMKRGLAKIVRWENHEHAGTVIFREGDPGQSWFVVLRGTLEARAPDRKNSVIHEGDDFGKLALLSRPSGGKTPNGTRQSTVSTAEDGCQLLRVEAAEFSKLLGEVETNTVRLKEFGGDGEAPGEGGKTEQDVLVLQRDGEAEAAQHSLIAGLPSNILEYVLETRVDLSRLSSSSFPSSSSSDDHLLSDVLLSLPLWMPSNQVCNVLKLYYSFGSVGTPPSFSPDPGDSEWHCWAQQTGGTVSKRRVVSLVLAWQQSLGHRFFLDSVANAFVEELFSCVLEDARVVEEEGDEQDREEMGQMVRQMEELVARREKAMRRFSRHPRLVLDRGLYSADSPAPNAVLPCDICYQSIRLFAPSSASFSASVGFTGSTILRVRMDKSAAEIAQMARTASLTRHRSQPDLLSNGTTEGKGEEGSEAEEMVLVEMRPGQDREQQRTVFGRAECSVPTMVAPGGILVAVPRAQLNNLAHLPEPPLPSARPLCLLIGPVRLAQAMALHHFKLFAATSQSELLVQIVGRDLFPPALAPSNLDLLLRRFHLVQCWASTELLLAPSSADRLAVLRSLIELGQLSRQHRDLLAFFALTLGLSTLPVARLHSVWAQLPPRLRRQHSESQFLLSPSRNHRNYRLFALQLRPPFVPFVPLLLKELSFIHDGRKSRFADGLVNFEKMHLIGQVLRSFEYAKGDNGTEIGGGGGGGKESPLEETMARLAMGSAQADEGLIRNLHAVDDQRRLMRISLGILPAPIPASSPHHVHRIRRDHS